MLQNMREHLQGWIAGIIIAVLCLAFALWGIQYYLESQGGGNAAAKVNGKAITVNQLNNAFERLQRQVVALRGIEYVSQPQVQQQLRVEALNSMIDDEALSQAAIKAGLQISSAQIEAFISTLPIFQEQGHFSPMRFQQITNSMLYSPQSFFQYIEKDLLINQFEQGVVASEFSLPNEVNQAIELTNQTRDFRYVIIRASQLKPNPDAISAAAIETYYTAHQQQFMMPEQVSLSYIELKQAAQAAPSEAMLRAFYQQHLNLYSTNAKWQVAKILLALPQNPTPAEVAAQEKLAKQIIQKLNAGASFATLAKTYSADSATKDSGGVMPWFTEDANPDLFQRMVLTLKVGQVSAPFETAAGINIIQLIAQKQATAEPFDQVKSKILQQYEGQNTDHAFHESVQKLSNLVYTNPDSLAPAAKALDLQVQTTDYFTKAGLAQGIASNSKVLTAAFSDAVLKQNQNSDVIQLDPKTVIVLRLNQDKPAYIKPLSLVKAEIIDQLSQQMAAEKAKQMGEQLLANLAKGEALPANYVWRNEVQVKRDNKTIDAEILQEAFSMPKPIAGHLSVAGIVLASGDYAIIELNKVEAAASALASEAEKQAMQKQINLNFAQSNYLLYQQGVLANSDIRRYQKNDESPKT